MMPSINTGELQRLIDLSPECSCESFMLCQWGVQCTGAALVPIHIRKDKTHSNNVEGENFKETKYFEGPCCVVWGTSLFMFQMLLCCNTEAAYCPLLMPGGYNLLCC